MQFESTDLQRGARELNGSNMNVVASTRNDSISILYACRSLLLVENPINPSSHPCYLVKHTNLNYSLSKSQVNIF